MCSGKESCSWFGYKNEDTDSDSSDDDYIHEKFASVSCYFQGCIIYTLRTHLIWNQTKQVEGSWRDFKMKKLPGLVKKAVKNGSIQGYRGLKNIVNK